MFGGHLLAQAGIDAEAQPLPTAVRSSSEAAIGLNAAYTLGAGDRVKVDVYNTSELSGEFIVGSDGSLDLPWAGNVAVNGMTVTEAKQEITAQYSQFLTRPPAVTLLVLTHRPVRVAMSGEVNRPGTYSTPLDRQSDDQDGGIQWPTLTKMLQEAGGITGLADVRQIQVQRGLRQGGAQVVTVDLWQLIQSGDMTQDVSLRDGDVVVVPKANRLSEAEAIRLGDANFAPESVNVQVVGEVVNPGAIAVPTNSSLNQAILAAGGFTNTRARTSTVNLVRLNPDGTVTQRSLKVDFAAAPNEETNPILRANDVVMVERSNVARASDGLGVILNPLSGVLNLLRLFGL
jgi:polysaccharide biosynthesis/export protein